MVVAGVQAAVMAGSCCVAHPVSLPFCVAISTYSHVHRVSAQGCVHNLSQPADRIVETRGRTLRTALKAQSELLPTAMRIVENKLDAICGHSLAAQKTELLPGQDEGSKRQVRGSEFSSPVAHRALRCFPVLTQRSLCVSTNRGSF